MAAELFTEVKGDYTLERLDVEEASKISRNACVSPCSLVLALLYLERLKDCNPQYLQQVAPSELFLVSLVLRLPQIKLAFKECHYSKYNAFYYLDGG